MRTFYKALSLVAILLYLASCSSKEDYKQWKVRGGSNASIRYSSLNQIDTSNVDRLQEAWSYRTGDADTARNSQIQTNPIIVDGILYGVSPQMKLFALDAASGEEQWVFDPFPDSANMKFGMDNNRGVTWWQDGQDRRIVYAAGSRLYAIDAEEGTPVSTFGEDGSFHLSKGLGERAQDLYVSATSPGVVYDDLYILGSRVAESQPAAPGHIRAFDIKTGELEWVFHTIPQPGEHGHDTWEDPDAWKRIGGANSWAGLTLDEERGILYAPTGSASPDFYGGNRKGANLFANSLLALDASTGERIWHYQTVHHDLWDRDLPSQPTLVTVTHEGEEVDAVAQTTKTGFVFLFDRETGEPLFPIEEVPVPTETNLKGEEVWPTQPMPKKPEPFARQQLDTSDINPYTSAEDRAYLKKRLKQMHSDHMFDPPSLEGTLMFPGTDGGAEWGGSAFDPETGLLYVNSNEVPWILRMLPAGASDVPEPETAKPAAAKLGHNIYQNNCMSCHGSERQGSGEYPALTNLGDTYTPKEVLELIENGRRMMPAFSYLSERETKAVTNYLMDETAFEIDAESSGEESTASSPYVPAGYIKFRTPGGYPASNPPWGTLNAINLNTGKYAWQIPLGEYPELAEKGIPTTGTENYGGPVVTAGGLVFIASTLDAKIRAFHKRTGEMLWESKLPSAGFATPAVYEIGGRQFVVIACGGGKLGTTSGDSYVAFRLKD